MKREPLLTYEVDQPWVVYTYLTTDRRTRFTGLAKIECRCAICGERKVLKLRIPRVGSVDRPADSKHPQHIRFLIAHLHLDRPHPMGWAQPLLNPATHPGGFDLALLAMRLETDLNKAEGASDA